MKPLPRNCFRAFVAAIALPLLSVSASAAVLAEYTAGGSTPDPVTQGWELTGNHATSPAVPLVGGVETIQGKSWDYWKISNAGTGDKTGFSALYKKTLAVSSFTTGDGWTATALLRVPSAATVRDACFLQVSDGVSSWEVIFVNNPTAGSSVNYRGTSTTAPIVLLANHDLGADYFTTQIFFDPATSSVSFFLNGVQIGSSIARTGVPESLSNQLYIRWGDNSATSTAVKTDSYWSEVRFETGYAVIPEPSASTALLTVGGLTLIVGRLAKWNASSRSRATSPLSLPQSDRLE